MEIPAAASPNPATLAKAEQVATLRAQGMTQQQVAEEMGVDQGTVSRMEAMHNKRDNIPIKSDNLPPPTSHRGTNSKTHTIARLKRDGHKDLAQQVESGQLPAAANPGPGHPGQPGEAVQPYAAATHV